MVPLRAAQPVSPTRTGQPLSRDALAQRLATHVATAAPPVHPSPRRPVTPHTLRHTATMRLLHAGVDTAVIALWLGHEHADTTNIYLVRAGRYRPPDKLLAFLEGL